MARQSTLETFAFIGGGQITEIVLENWIGNDLIRPDQVIVSSRGAERLTTLQTRFGVQVTYDNVAAMKQADFISVNVRPEVVADVIKDLAAAQLRSSQLVVSLAAGISLTQYDQVLPGQPLVRVLPNPPSRIGEGVVALHINQKTSAEQQSAVKRLFSALGTLVEVEESRFNVITALSSPVATYLFFESLIAAGVRGGLKRSIATEIAAQTILGSMAVWQNGDDSPHGLMAEASTPGGISVESLFTLEKLGFKPAVMEAIAQGAQRAASVASE